MYVGVLLDYPSNKVVTVEADFWYTSGEDQSITIERKLPQDDDAKYNRTEPVVSLRYWQAVVRHESREGAETALRTLYPDREPVPAEIKPAAVQETVSL